MYRYIAPDSKSRSSPTYSRRSRSRGGDSDSSRSRSASPAADTLEFITNLGDDTAVEDSKPSLSDSMSSNTDNLPPHLRVGASSSAASW